MGGERQKKGFKRKRGPDDDGGDDEPPRVGKPTIGMQTSFIGNKQVRSEKYNDLRREKKKAKKKERKQRDKEAAKAIELGQEPPKKQVPRTIENTREADETTVRDDDEEVAADVADDEFAPHFARDAAKPHVLLTTSRKPTAVMFKFLQDLLTVLPCTYYKRGAYHIKEICEYAKNLGFSDVMVVNEDRKNINGLLLIHLPDGPTAHFRISNVVLSKKIKGHGRATTHRPELILNNFSTRLGHRVGRMFASVFPTDPQFRGRRAVTFHNQRDFIFFRHHRYIFQEKENKKDKSVIARLQELGPRFTLKLLSLQKGTFDSKSGEYEWVHKPEMDTSRRKFFL